MAQTAVDHFYGMGEYSSQLCLSQSLFHSHFPVGGWWHYWNHTTLSELIIGDNVIKIVGLDMLWHYKIKNTNSMEGHVVGIFIFGFLISETAQCPTWQ